MPSNMKMVVLNIEHAGFPIAEVSKKFPKLKICLFCQPISLDEKRRFICKLVGDEFSRKKYVRMLKKHPLVSELEFITSIKNSSVISLIVDYSKGLHGIRSILTKFGHHHSFLSKIKGGFGRWILFNKDFSTIEDLIRELEKTGSRVKLEKVQPIVDLNVILEFFCLNSAIKRLTHKQKHVFKVAYSMGYYDKTKRVTLDQVARYLKLSTPTVWNQLRAVETKIFESLSEIIT